VVLMVVFQRIKPGATKARGPKQGKKSA